MLASLAPSSWWCSSLVKNNCPFLWNTGKLPVWYCGKGWTFCQCRKQGGELILDWAKDLLGVEMKTGLSIHWEMATQCGEPGGLQSVVAELSDTTGHLARKYILSPLGKKVPNETCQVKLANLKIELLWNYEISSGSIFGENHHIKICIPGSN